jgi:GNAT superfamily N-acetyltransferase
MKDERGKTANDEPMDAIHSSLLTRHSSFGSRSTATLTRMPPRQPEITLRIGRVPQSMWQRFAPHHYLAGGLARSATCYAAWWEEAESNVVPSRREGQTREAPLPARHGGKQVNATGPEVRAPTAVDPRVRPLQRKRPTVEAAAPVAFCAVVAALGWKRTKRITRLVVLPQFQGLGIGSRLAEAVAELEHARGQRITITATHPAIVAHCSRSPRWRYLGVKKNGSTQQQLGGRTIRSSLGRAVASFEWVEGERGGLSP